jgi:hypothetical protein
MVGVSCQIVDLCSALITVLAARLYRRNFFPERMTCADYLTAILCVDADVTRHDPACGESLPKEPEERNEGAKTAVRCRWPVQGDAAAVTAWIHDKFGRGAQYAPTSSAPTPMDW